MGPLWYIIYNNITTINILAITASEHHKFTPNNVHVA